MTPLLAARAVSAGYGGRSVIEDVTFEVAAGESWAVVGPNAAGKSTLLRVLVGAQPPVSGEILLAGEKLRSVPPRARASRLALVPQSVRYDLDFTVREIVALGRAPRTSGWGLETPGDRAVIERALSLFELYTLADRSFGALSGGERQRALLARAYAQQADVWLLDEPMAHLDLAHQLLVADQVRAHATTGGAAIVVLHDLGLAMRFDRVLVLDRGRVAATGRPREVLDPALLARTWGVDASIEEAGGAWGLVVRGRIAT